ncbi:hypothetical protein [Desulfoluna spongiiphila]|uniref:hypothetical protein n=1 Tax=Desulfoluna spongiiphila TaxID=419481 RepID=UPI00125FB911|nr:hypothetical protein [Desulfoluna spongiiphila]
MFEYDIIEDGPSLGDYWFENLEIAFESCKEDYGIDQDEWKTIPDPLEHCQQDWIEPIRVVGRSIDDPQWGRFEKLVNGKWLEINKK